MSSYCHACGSYLHRFDPRHQAERLSEGPEGSTGREQEQNTVAPIEYSNGGLAKVVWCRDPTCRTESQTAPAAEDVHALASCQCAIAQLPPLAGTCMISYLHARPPRNLDKCVGPHPMQYTKIPAIAMPICARCVSSQQSICGYALST